MNHSVLVSLTAIALACLSNVSTAQTPASPQASAPAVGHMRHQGLEHPFMRVLHHLNLTAAQKKQIHSIYQAARPQMESLGRSIRSNMDELMMTPPGDAAYSALIETAKSNAAAHIKLISDTQAQIYDVLTPEQKAKIPGIVVAMKAKRDAARQKWHAAHEQPATN